ncbi:hypothetical protein BGY98DRAFT_1186715 [Russula aff. rugulosa BPL654]|nr:hypothetical protein BGY98DRAFT_1186715 [Russula aff. rugulosa BPL654]
MCGVGIGDDSMAGVRGTTYPFPGHLILLIFIAPFVPTGISPSRSRWRTSLTRSSQLSPSATFEVVRKVEVKYFLDHWTEIQS